ncbi:P-loop containing nucleoside triphosphate hydrolase protein [Colletotrichum sublineola]|nr:P-loop containing nucleoside triphosphate hydrolase protein [Colletotrichum sublineola]
MVFPHTMMGYDLQQNKWRDVDIDLVQNVSWNKQTFDYLAIDEEGKDLLCALATDSIESKQSADSVQDESSRLTIILHGGPGTGKTHTAESIAEKVQKPLIRVECNDIGNEPQEVQRHLDSAFYLGKAWRCVILLDEADAFLEQRTAADPGRNTLVSVFVRMLTHHTGIVIITTSQVGSFDEAFTSCIQLPFHYKTLSISQRRRIWANLLRRLDLPEQNNNETQPATGQNKRKFVEMKGIDLDNIERHLPELAEEEMNGHQIRNAITTAVRLARNKDETMTYKHLERVIKISQRFHKSLEQARGDGADE